MSWLYGKGRLLSCFDNPCVRLPRRRLVVVVVAVEPPKTLWPLSPLFVLLMVCGSYMGDMPWLSVPYDGKTRGTIAQLLGVSALPTLLVFDEEQQLITANGRQEIIKDQKAENFPWYPKVSCEM